MAGVEKPQIVKLAPVSGEQQAWNHILWDRISSTNIATNLAILLPIAARAEEISAAMQPGKPQDQLLSFAARVREMQSISTQANPMLPTLDQTQTADETLTVAFPQMVRLGDSPESLSQHRSTLAHVLRSATKPVVVISDSHVTLLPQLEAVQEVVPSQIGVFFIDAHADIVTLAGENIYNMYPPHKANVAREITRSGLARAVAIAGIDHILYEEITTGFSRRGANAIGTHMYYRQHRDSIFLSPSGREQQSAQQLVALLKQQGVTNLVFSVDIDALQNGGTAMEYTPFAQLALLSVLQLQSIEHIDLTSDETIAYVAERLSNAFRDPSIEEDFFPQDMTADELRTLQEITSMTGTQGDTSLTEALQLIRDVKFYCAQEGIAIGVRLPQGGSYIGDITEISGFDALSQTAYAAAQIATELGGSLA